MYIHTYMYTYQQVPCFMVLLHLGFSCLLLFTTSAFMHVLRDIFGDVLGLLMLALCVWSIPGTIEVACTLGVLLYTLGVLLYAHACPLCLEHSRHHRGSLHSRRALSSSHSRRALGSLHSRRVVFGDVAAPSRSANSIYVSVHTQIYVYIYVYV